MPPQRIVEAPDLTSIVPHLIVPGLLSLLLLLWAKMRGATWTQVQLSFGAAMLGAFMTAGGWVFGAYMSGERLEPWKILGSQALVAAACGLLVFFGSMPTVQDLTDELEQQKQHPEE